MSKKLRISLIFSNLVVLKSLSSNHRMHNLYTKFVKILGICKQFSNNLVNAQGNVPRCGPKPKFSDLEVVALSLAAESESIDSENWLFEYKLQGVQGQNPEPYIPQAVQRPQEKRRRTVRGHTQAACNGNGRRRGLVLRGLQTDRGMQGCTWQTLQDGTDGRLLESPRLRVLRFAKHLLFRIQAPRLVRIKRCYTLLRPVEGKRVRPGLYERR